MGTVRAPAPLSPPDQGGSYVLISPVRNEAATLSATIHSVTSQTLLPSEWVIVSDGSTDGTDALVRDAARTFSWIRLLARPPRPDSRFDAIVRNIVVGVGALSTREYAYLGLLDGDVRFSHSYFASLLRRFADNPLLGLTGGVVIDPSQPRDRVPRNRRDVPGAVQFFRRVCFERIGELIPVPEGGWDCLTCAMARMCGFETQLATDLIVDHLKPRNVSQGGRLARLYQLGGRDYALGYDPLFEFFKCVGRSFDSPVVFGSLARGLGFGVASVVGRPRIVPDDLVRFLRGEQRMRLNRLFRLTG